MNDVIESDEFDVVRKALEKGNIGLKQVEKRFVDFKMAYCKNSYQQNGLRADLNDNYRRSHPKARKVTPEQAARDYCFLSNSKPANYICIWQAYQKKTDSAHDYHCDGSKSSRVVPNAINKLYTNLWPNTIAESGDTMNSMRTTYNAYIAKGHHAERNPEIEKQLQLLAYLTHTLGNFIPCGDAFNSGRYNATQDYWDITLMYIKDWYLNRQLFALESNLPSNTFNAGALGANRDWLNSFGEGQDGWNTFIEKNYLEAYVNKIDEDETYGVKPFYDGHSPHPNKLKPEGDAVYKCLLSMNAAIIARGNEMRRKVLKEKIDEEDWKLFFKDPYPQSSSSPR